MDYGSPFYIFSLVFLLALAFGAWAVLRRLSEKQQHRVIFVLMLMNTLQHLCKPLLYPQYHGMGFSSLETAYNMCAVLILASPWVFLWGSRFLKNFVFFVGTVAGIAAISLPYWYIGMEVAELGWDYFRFYFCHAVLFVASVLPLALRLHKPRWREFWQVGLAFLLALCVILLNDVIFICLGLYPGADAADLYGSLLRINPCMLMGPPEGLPWVRELVGMFTPDSLMGGNPAGLCAPILWYAIPVYLGISLLALIVFSLVDRAGFRADIRRRKEMTVNSTLS